MYATLGDVRTLGAVLAEELQGWIPVAVYLQSAES